MKDNEKSGIASTGTVTGSFEDCGVIEEQFPHLEKCCHKRAGSCCADYEEICPYCTVWISPPDPSTLEVAAIFECKRLGYGKRIKNI